MDGEPPDITIPPPDGKRHKVYVDGVSVSIVAERVEYLDEDGKLVTESLRDFTRKALRKHYASLDDFLRRWKGAERKQAVLSELAEEGLPFEPLAEELGKDLDPFDLICHIAFDRPPLTRVLQIAPFDRMGTPVQLVRAFGSAADYARAVGQMQTALYEDVA